VVYPEDKLVGGGAGLASRAESEAKTGGVILLVEPRTLIRECIVQCLRQAAPGYQFLSVSSMAEWSKVAPDHSRPDAIVLCISEKTKTGGELELSRQLFSDSAQLLPVVVLADEEDPTRVLEALDAGAKAFMSTTVSLDVAIEALRLVLAGGTYVPASSLLASRAMAWRAGPDTEPSRHALFTDRQFAVIERLREGKANKIIAYELNMRESTVKVHIRNIMRKLRATNRTQVAYLYQSMLSENKGNGASPSAPINPDRPG
jgi:DNA-binding NarL/FixJ family response regulator